MPGGIATGDVPQRSGDGLPARLQRLGHLGSPAAQLGLLLATRLLAFFLLLAPAEGALGELDDEVVGGADRLGQGPPLGPVRRGLGAILQALGLLRRPAPVIDLSTLDGVPAAQHRGLQRIGVGRLLRAALDLFLASRLYGGCLAGLYQHADLLGFEFDGLPREILRRRARVPQHLIDLLLLPSDLGGQCGAALGVLRLPLLHRLQLVVLARGQAGSARTDPEETGGDRRRSCGCRPASCGARRSTPGSRLCGHPSGLPRFPYAAHGTRTWRPDRDEDDRPVLGRDPGRRTCA